MFRKLESPPRDALEPRFDWRIAAPFFALNLFFPLFVAALGWLLF